MNCISVYPEEVKDILQEIKRQYINIKLQNRSGISPNQYFVIDEIKEFKGSPASLTALVIHSPTDSKCAVIDLRSIERIKLDKYFNYQGQVWNEVHILTPVASVIQSRSFAD